MKWKSGGKQRLDHLEVVNRVTEFHPYHKNNVKPLMSLRAGTTWWPVADNEMEEAGVVGTLLQELSHKALLTPTD